MFGMMGGMGGGMGMVRAMLRRADVLPAARAHTQELSFWWRGCVLPLRKLNLTAVVVCVC